MLGWGGGDEIVSPQNSRSNTIASQYATSMPLLRPKTCPTRMEPLPASVPVACVGDSFTKTAKNPKALKICCPDKKRWAAEQAKLCETIVTLLSNKDTAHKGRDLFWAELKACLNRHFGSLGAAFKCLDSSGDGYLNLIEFGEVLRLIRFTLDSRSCKQLFDHAAGSDRTISLHQLGRVMMASTIQKLKAAANGCNRTQERIEGHIRRFLMRLAFANDQCTVRTLDRFQRKISVPFCKAFFNYLTSRMPRNFETIDRGMFGQVVTSIVWTRTDLETGRLSAIRLQAHDVGFMLRIFDQIDTSKRGVVETCDLVTMLVISGSESDRDDKLQFIFHTFDTDDDGCLFLDQVMHAFDCVSMQWVKAGGQILNEKINDKEFQKELVAAECRRNFHCIVWTLRRSCNVHGSEVTWEELNQAFLYQPEVLNLLIPSPFRILWAISGELCSAQAEVLHPCSLKHHDSQKHTHVHGKAPKAFLVPRDGNRRRKAATAATSHAHNKPLTPEDAACDGGGPKPKDQRESTKFKQETITRFRETLACESSVREFELWDGQVFSPLDPGQIQAPRAQPVMLPSLPSENAIGELGSLRRESLHAWPMIESMERMGTAPSGTQAHVRALRRRDGPELRRTNSRHVIRSSHFRHDDTGSLVASVDELPAIEPRKWGDEASDRFRIFANAKLQAELKTGRPLVDAEGSAEDFGYHCKLCGHVHNMSVPCCFT